MSESDSIKIAVLETDVSYIKGEVSEIKEMLRDHIKWEADKYDEMDKKFVRKDYEVLLKLVEQRQVDHIENADKKYASKWIEKFAISVAVTVVGAIVVALLFS